jgi:hypothetical protein
MLAPVTADFYYLANFLGALRWVEQRYADLLSSAEQGFISSFQQLPQPSQALLARLLLRKGPHFRSSALNYPEIGDCVQAAGPLLKLGWLRTDAPLGVAQLHRLLRRAELLEVFADRPELRQLTKTAMLAHLEPTHPQQHSFSQWCPELDEQLLTLTIAELCEHLRLIFFGNLRQDWSEFVLTELGIFRYEDVPLCPSSRGFSCRADIEQHMQLYRAREAFEAGASPHDTLEMIAGLQPVSGRLQNRLEKLRFSLARELERQGERAVAFAAYEACSYPGARQRRIRLMETGGCLESALELAEQALRSPESDTEEQLLERAVRRLRSRLGHKAPRPRTAREGRFELTLPRADTGVEWAVREHLHEEQAPVHYVENALLNSLFGLLCWDVIFAPLPGAFFHPFHSAPADLHDPDFHARRREAFAARFAELDAGTHAETIRRNWRDKFGIQSPFVFWSVLDEQVLEQALACLPPAHLRIWFERLLLDIRANRCGMPDLIQFWPAERRYRMIEVKGPGDRLQDNQRRWLDLCARHQMPVEVCYVNWADT